MKVEKQQDDFFDVTTIHNLFITEYLPALDGNAVKVYLYLLYLSENRKACGKDAIAAILNVDGSVVDAAFVQLGACGLIHMDGNHIYLENIERKEIERNYRPRTSKRPDEESETGANKAKNQMIRAVSDRFFSGQMPNSWYGEIDLWVAKYGFSPEVIYMLFQHCGQNNAITKPYMRKVAESWGGQHHIKTAEQLDQYFRTYEEFDKIRKEIRKRLHIQAPLTDYQSEYVERWFYTYGYGMEIIGLALKEGAGLARPTFNLYEKILKDWYERGLKTVQDVKTHLMARNKKSGTSGKTTSAISNAVTAIPQKDNYDQRTYADGFFDYLYKGGGQA